MLIHPKRREQARALALATMLAVSLVALAVVPTGLAAEPEPPADATPDLDTNTDTHTDRDTITATTATALEYDSLETTDGEDAENFDGEGDPIDLEGDGIMQHGGHEYDGRYYLVGGFEERVYVYNEAFGLLDEHDLEFSPAGITRFDGQWVISNWEDDELRVYDDDTFTDPQVIDLEDTEIGGSSTTPWSLDTDADRLYVTDENDIAVLDTAFEEVDRIETELTENAKGLHVTGDRLFVMESNTETTVYEYDTDGTELRTYDAPPEGNTEYEDNTRGLMLLGGDWYVSAADIYTEIYRFPATVGGDTGSTATISGIVTDQRGQPAPNMAVTAHGVTDHAYPDLDGLALEREAQSLLEELEDPLPDTFDPDYDLDAHTDVDSTYALVHEQRDWGVGTTTIVDSSIDDPRVTVDQDQAVVISLWDPSADGGWIENQVDQSSYGATTEGTVVIEQLSPTDEITDTRTIETEPIATTTGTNPLTETEHHGVQTTLPPGVYRASPEDNEAGGYAFTVGCPADLASGFEDGLRDEADRLTDRADRIRNLTAENKLVTESTQADANGEFELEIDDSAATVTVQPIGTTDGALSDLDLETENPTVADLRDLEHDGALYLPTPETQTYAPPADNIEVSVYRTPTLPFSELEAYADFHDELEAAFLDANLSELDGWDERLDELEDDRRSELEDALADLLEDERDDDHDEDLETILERLDDLERSLDVGDGELGDDALVSWTVPEEITADDVTVLAHTDDGETTPVDEQYWTLEDSGLLDGGLFDDPTVTLEDHPFDDETTVAEYEIHIADDGAYGSASTAVLDPAFDGEIPALDALSFSTLSPGPSEHVSVDVHEREDVSATVTDAEVFGPDGDTQPAEIDDSTGTDRVAFETAGDGVHHVRLTLESATGDEFVVSERIRANDQTLPDYPTLRAGTSVVGEYAVIGDRLEHAWIDSDAGDGTIAITAVADPDDTPGELHIQPDRILSSDTHEFDVSVVEGADEEPVDSHVPVRVHLEEYDPEDAVHWRDGDAITIDGDTRWGEVDQRDQKSVLTTFTDERGALEELRIVENANWYDRAVHRIDRSFVPLPLSVSLPDGLPVPDAADGVGGVATTLEADAVTATPISDRAGGPIALAG